MACKLVPFLPQASVTARMGVEANVTEAEAEVNVANVRQGGSWWPENCTAPWSVAVVVPYRDREHMIGPFLNHLHPFLQRQMLNYSIYFVEQSAGKTFNKAMLLNIGYKQAQAEGPWDCYVFHDIDCVPEDDRNLYYCSSQPRHLAVSPDKFGYKLFYPTCFGGASLMSGWQIERVNGWSNRYFGWGGEDDDMWDRIHAEGMEVKRYPEYIATYTMLKHAEAEPNPERYELLAQTLSSYKNDGLNTLNYTLASTTRRQLYTKFLVEI
ncbi:beta-1,4-N-acetylgalactosaminyltransferase bre-4-like isoform X2 [Penaeus japonicus]|uniref:beta-1,4-N-acetylgalactosaminyltransferase bre-4-like isoform X2 n=1 Tax=Penaeus japonicus TaxID=27405 RepID=UPI001C7165E7|nr:beta-1,4-N-acetylgalactosaminyltransferase bre-4-like isoform X2 [Penaeus japonicus]